MGFRFITVMLIALFMSNVMAGELSVLEDKAVIEFETRLGIVTFAHQKHADLSITQCVTCHHDLEPADTLVKPCHECHQHKSKVTSNAPSKAKTAFHNRCIGCHEYTVAGGQNAGPLKKKCKLCHVKPPKD